MCGGRVLRTGMGRLRCTLEICCLRSSLHHYNNLSRKRSEEIEAVVERSVVNLYELVNLSLITQHQHERGPM
jgi:hypothetical protein